MTAGGARTPLVLALEVLRAFALAAIVAAVVSGGDGAGPSILAVAAVVGGSWALARGLAETDLAEGGARRAGLAASVIALAVILRLDYAGGAPWSAAWLRELVAHPGTTLGEHRAVAAGILVLIVVWARGVARGPQTAGAESVLPGVAGGFVLVVIAAAAGPRTHGPELFGALAVVYLALALVTLAVFQAPDPDAPIRQLASRWATGGVVLLGVAAALTVVAASIDPGSVGVLSPLGRPLAFVLDALGRFVFGPLFTAIAWPFQLIASLFPRQDTMPEQQMQTPVDRPEPHGAPLWARVAAYVISGGVATLLAAGLLFLLWASLRRRVRRAAGPPDVREQVEREGTVRDDMAMLWADLARRFRRPPPAPAAAAGVRRLYHEMLADAAADGLPRPQAATPLQFAPELGARYGEPAPSEISAAFSVSRYGQVELDDGDVESLRAAWQRARAIGRPPAP